MLFFMGSNFHYPVGENFLAGGLDMIIGLVIIALIEVNAIFGKLFVLEKVPGVITSSVVLTVIMVGVLALL